MTTSTTQHKFTALDGIRGLLALVVAYGHFPGALYFPGAPRFNSGLCVDFFFLLSGFVIAHNTRSGLNSGRSALNFMLRRFGRLWPLHTALLGVLILCKLESTLVIWLTGDTKPIPFLTSAYNLPSVTSNLLMLQGFGPNGSWNYPSWSIGTEFWTYLLLALLLWGTSRKITALAAIGLIAIAVTIQTIFPTMANTISIGGSLRCLAGFFTGYLLYHRFSAQPARSLPRPLATLSEVAAIGIIITAIAFMEEALSLTIIAPALFAIPLWVFAHQTGAVSQLLRHKTIQTLGVLSYGIYMVHAPVIEIFNHWWKIGQKALMKTYGSTCAIGYANAKTASPADCGPADVMILLVLLSLYFYTVIKIAHVSYRYMEAPARATFNARFPSPRESPAKAD